MERGHLTTRLQCVQQMNHMGVSLSWCVVASPVLEQLKLFVTGCFFCFQKVGLGVP